MKKPILIIALVAAMKCSTLHAQLAIKLDMDIEIVEKDSVTKDRRAVLFSDDRSRRRFYFILDGERQDFVIVSYLGDKEKFPESNYTGVALHTQSGHLYTIALYQKLKTTYIISNTQGNFPFWVFKYNGLQEVDETESSAF